MFKNPTLVHIAVETTFVLALIFWVSSTNRKTNFFIKNLLQRISDLEDRLVKIESLEERITNLESRAPKAPSYKKVSISEPVEEKRESLVYSRSPSPIAILDDDNNGKAFVQEIDTQFEKDLEEELEKLE